MLDHNASSCKKQILNSENIKSTNSICRTYRSILPFATAAVCLWASNQSALAIDIDTQVAENITFSHSSLAQDDINEYEHDCQHHQHQDRPSGFIPRIVSLIAAPFQTHLNILNQGCLHKKDSQEVFHGKGIGGSFTQNLAPIYLSQATLSSPKEFLASTTIQSIKPANNIDLLAIAPKSELYTVKTGDTINLIADKYKVSSQELIALNEIQDSNVILTNQKLKIPINKLNKIQLAEISLTQTNFPQDSQAQEIASNTNTFVLKRNAKADIFSDDLQEKRLANLRAEINQMRSEMKQERENSKNLNEEKEEIVSSVNPENNQDSNVILEESVSLKLPPLPPSEEYLPEAFDGYSWPAQGVLSSGYGWRWGRLHKGIDIAAPVGTPIFAAAAGEVVSAGWNSGGYGNLIKLEHLDGSITLYAHNNRILVSNGQRVRQGQQIAEMGNTGFSTGSHLHFEIHSRNQGVINPLALLKR